MFKEKLNLKISLETLKIFGALTVVFTLVGVVFGRILDGFVNQSQGNYQLVEEPVGSIEADGVVDTSEIAVDNNQVFEESPDHIFYVMQLGAFETLDNALALGGTLDDKNITWGVNRQDGKHYVFSYIVGQREQLQEVEQTLAQSHIKPFIRSEEIIDDDLGWQYFLKAVNQIPYEMEASFIQSFTNDEMHIFGFYMTLSSVSFDPLSTERQEMLLEIYHWLNN